MPDHYDEKGNIPGPTRWQSKEDKAVLDKENIWIDSAREGTVDIGNQILDTLKYGGAVKGGVKLPKVPKLPPSQHKTINITPQKANKLLDDVLIRRTDRIIPKYSSGPIVQTNKSTMYRPDPGTMQSTFQSVNPDQLDLPFDEAELAQYQKDMRNPNIPLTTRLDLTDSVSGSSYRASEPFDVFGFRDQSKFMKDKGRRFLSIFQAGLTNYGASKAANFKANQPGITNPLKIEYSRTNLPDTSFQVHHRAALKSIMGNFHGLDIGSPVFNEVADAILEEVPWLGLGDNPENWMGIIGSTADKGTPHHLAHKYYNKIIGPSGEKFYTKEVVERMMVDRKFRVQKGTEMGRIINKSNQIVTQATELWEIGFSNKQRFKNFDALVNHLSKFDELGYNALSDPEYEAGVFTDVITQIATDPSMVPTSKPEVDLAKQTKWERRRKNQIIEKETKAIDKPKPVNPDQFDFLNDIFD